MWSFPYLLKIPKTLDTKIKRVGDRVVLGSRSATYDHFVLLTHQMRVVLSAACVLCGVHAYSTQKSLSIKSGSLALTRRGWFKAVPALALACPIASRADNDQQPDDAKSEPWRVGPDALGWGNTNQVFKEVRCLGGDGRCRRALLKQTTLMSTLNVNAPVTRG